MSEGNFIQLFDIVKQSAGAGWGRLNGIAGNTYNDGGKFDGNGDGILEEPVLGRIGLIKSRLTVPLLITETGPKANEWTLPTGFAKLANEAAGGNLLGALFFNGFCTGSGWGDYCLSSGDLANFCSTGDCNKLGGNSAREYWTPDLYDKVKRQPTMAGR